MPRAGKTPHGARPNREEARGFGRGHVPARCVKPPGRSLEPRSNARPRGMVVPPQGGQNSAYRSGCQQVTHFPVVATVLLTFWNVAGILSSRRSSQCGIKFDDLYGTSRACHCEQPPMGSIRIAASSELGTAAGTTKPV